MGKKDEEIKQLKEMVSDLATEKIALDKDNKKLTATSKQLVEHNEQLRVQHAEQLQQFQDKFKELSEHKQLMITTVNVTGVQDVGQTCDDAVTLLESRLEKLNLKDKYTILAVPHTMSIGIVR